jgi:hypothetical protein
MISAVPKIPRKISTAKRQMAFVLNKAANFEERRNTNKVKEQRERTK